MKKNLNLQNIIVARLCFAKKSFHVSIHLELSKVSVQFHSGDYKRFFVPLMIIISQEEFFAPWAKKAQRILSSDGAVGADEPLQVRLSSQKSLHGLTAGSEWGSGQRPEALRRNCNYFISFLSFFQLGKKT